MPKPIQRKRAPRLSKETRVAEILKAAREIFEEYGYENAKITDIAEKIGVVEGTVFHYFSSKRLLVMKVIEAFYHGITAGLGDRLQGIEGTRNRLHCVLSFHLNTLKNDSRLCGVILRESRGLDPELTRNIHKFNHDYTDFFISVLKQGIAAGEIREDTSVPMVRNTAYGSMEHTLWSLLSEDIAIDVETQARDLTDLIFEGVSVQSSRNNNEISALARKLTRLIDLSD